MYVAGGAYPCVLKVIEGLTYRAVLGRDFLRANGAVINLQAGMLELENHSPSTYTEDLRPINVLSSYLIPPRSEAVISVRVHGSADLPICNILGHFTTGLHDSLLGN